MILTYFTCYKSFLNPLIFNGAHFWQAQNAQEALQNFEQFITLMLYFLSHPYLLLSYNFWKDDGQIIDAENRPLPSKNIVDPGLLAILGHYPTTALMTPFCTTLPHLLKNQSVYPWWQCNRFLRNRSLYTNRGSPLLCKGSVNSSFSWSPSKCFQDLYLFLTHAKQKWANHTSQSLSTVLYICKQNVSMLLSEAKANSVKYLLKILLCSFLSYAHYSLLFHPAYLPQIQVPIQ